MEDNVKELLEELKNLSGLMLNLAYSAILFESKEIAKEVIALNKQVTGSEEKLLMHLFAGTRGAPDARLVSIVNLLVGIKRIASAARELGEIVVDGKELHPLAKAALQESDESIVRVAVTNKSPLCEKTLSELKLRTEMGIDIIAIKRSMGQWIINPKKTCQIVENDILIGVGPVSSCMKIKKLAKGVVKKL